MLYGVFDMGEFIETLGKEVKFKSTSSAVGRCLLLKVTDLVRSVSNPELHALKKHGEINYKLMCEYSKSRAEHILPDLNDAIILRGCLDDLRNNKISQENVRYIFNKLNVGDSAPGNLLLYMNNYKHYSEVSRNEEELESTICSVRNTIMKHEGRLAAFSKKLELSLPAIKNKINERTDLLVRLLDTHHILSQYDSYVLYENAPFNPNPILNNDVVEFDIPYYFCNPVINDIDVIIDGIVNKGDAVNKEERYSHYLPLEYSVFMNELTAIEYWICLTLTPIFDNYSEQALKALRT